MIVEELSIGNFVRYNEEARYVRVTGFLSRDYVTLVVCVDGWGQTVKLDPQEITDVRRDDEVDDEGYLIEED